LKKALNNDSPNIFCLHRNIFIPAKTRIWSSIAVVFLAIFLWKIRYKAFPPAKSRKLVQRLEIHYTPKHGSWLNIAECELSALTRQCLNRRIPDMKRLSHETKAWERCRNSSQKGIDWQFSTKDARI